MGSEGRRDRQPFPRMPAAKIGVVADEGVDEAQGRGGFLDFAGFEPMQDNPLACQEDDGSQHGRQGDDDDRLAFKVAAEPVPRFEGHGTSAFLGAFMPGGIRNFR